MVALTLLTKIVGLGSTCLIQLIQSSFNRFSVTMEYAPNLLSQCHVQMIWLLHLRDYPSYANSIKVVLVKILWEY